MAKPIVLATPQSLAEFLAIPAAPRIGRPANEFTLFANRQPMSVRDKRKAGYVVSLDDHFEHPEQIPFDADDDASFAQFNALNWS